jgi:hypothetical protein
MFFETVPSLTWKNVVYLAKVMVWSEGVAE